MAQHTPGLRRSAPADGTLNFSSGGRRLKRLCRTSCLVAYFAALAAWGYAQAPGVPDAQVCSVYLESGTGAGEGLFELCMHLTVPKAWSKCVRGRFLSNIDAAKAPGSPVFIWKYLIWDHRCGVLLRSRFTRLPACRAPRGAPRRRMLLLQ